MGGHRTDMGRVLEYSISLISLNIDLHPIELKMLRSGVEILQVS